MDLGEYGWNVMYERIKPKMLIMHIQIELCWFRKGAIVIFLLVLMTFSAMGTCLGLQYSV